MKDIIGNLKIQDLILEIQSPLRENVELIANEGVAYEKIGLEMANNPSFGLVSKGGNRWDRNIFQLILSEIRSLVCTDDVKYKELRDQFKIEKNKTSKVVVATLSGFLGAKFGMTAGICAPFVIIALAAILKVGVEAFCSIPNGNGAQSHPN